MYEFITLKMLLVSDVFSNFLVDMAFLRIICWAIIFITRLRFPPGYQSLLFWPKTKRNAANKKQKQCVRSLISKEMFCSGCGSALISEANFCHSCASANEVLNENWLGVIKLESVQKSVHQAPQPLLHSLCLTDIDNKRRFQAKAKKAKTGNNAGKKPIEDTIQIGLTI